MSLYNKASIVLAPGAYKEGRIFNQKPLGESSDLKFDRGTSGSVQTRKASDNKITSVSLDVPRIDYGGGVGHLLIEPESTNLITYSVDFNGSSWVTNNDITITDGFSSPDGGNNASKISTDPQASQSTKGILFSGYNTTTRLTDSRSIWAKTVSGTGQLHLLSHHSNTGNLFNITEEWQRFDLTGYNSTGANNFYAVDFRGSSTLTEVYLWGGQAEDNPFTTSYIPTSGSTATRAVETAVDGGVETLFGQTEGVLYVEMAKFENDSNTGQVSISSDSRDNLVSFKAVTLNRFQMQLRAGGNPVKTVTSSDNISDNTNFNKYAVSYKSGEIKVFANGSQIGSTGTETFSFSSNIISLKLNSGNEGNDDFRGKIKCIAVFKETLTDSELQELTS